MAGSEDNNALAAKVKAMYGRRLTAQNYKELLRKQTVNEVAAYLKQETSYSELLRDINESLIHRGELENILRRQVFEEYSKLSNFVDRGDRSFFQYVVTGMEIDEILTCIRYINAGRTGEYIYTLPAFFSKHASFDLYALAKVKNFTDLVDMLAGTPYHEILEKFQLNAEGKADTVLIEIEFHRYYYTHIFRTISKTYTDEALNEVRKSFGMEVDLENLLMIYRLKKYFNAPSDYIKSLLLPYHYCVNKDDLDRILQENDAEAARKAIFETRYGPSFKQYNFEYLEKYCDQIQYNYHKRLVMMATTTPVLVTSYMHLKNTELNNVINIIEGIRYSLAPSEINKLLILTDE